jgi:hypothetical protein
MIKCEAQKSKCANILGRREYILKTNLTWYKKLASALFFCYVQQLTWFSTVCST